MNELFEQLGYEGPAFMKITNSVRETITAHSGDIHIESVGILIDIRILILRVSEKS